MRFARLTSKDGTQTAVNLDLVELMSEGGAPLVVTASVCCLDARWSHASGYAPAKVLGPMSGPEHFDIRV